MRLTLGLALACGADLSLHGQPACARRQGFERNVYSVTGWVRRVGSQEGGDWQVELKKTRREALDSCVVVQKPRGKDDSTFERARAKFERLLGSNVKSSGYTDPAEAMRTKFMVPAFFDGEQRRKAPNRHRGNPHGRCDLSLWEIHPVYWVLKP